MKCEDLLKALNDYVDGAIDPAICETFENHLAGCNPCQVVVDNIRKTITLYKGDEVFEIPVELRTRLHSKLRERWHQIHGSDRPSTPGDV
jgi:anti-sigma factor RsiW